MRSITVVLLVAVATLAAGCAGGRPGGAGAQAGNAAATPETAAAPSARAPASLWFDDLQMISSSGGWALVWNSDPNGHATLETARTTDGGRTWAIVTPAAAGPLLVNGTALLHAQSAQRAWVAVTHGSTTVVFSTRNGGRDWAASAPIPGAGPVAMDFSGAARGWLLQSLGAAMGQEPVRVYATADGGVTWSLLASGLPAGCDKTAIAVSPALAGWISTACNGGATALVSRDGGVSWIAEQLLPASACPAGCVTRQLQFAGDAAFLEVSAYPAAARLLVSNDNGLTWATEPMPAGAGSYPRVMFFGAADAIAVSAGSQGAIGPDFYLTVDGGRSWTAVPQGSRFAAGSSFDFVTTQVGFSFDPGGQQLSLTTDSGRVWTSFAPQLG